MELSAKQQAVELTQKASRVLIATHEKPDGDALGSVLALSQALKKLGKTVEAVAPEPAPEALAFLPGVGTLGQQVTSSADFVIAVNTAATPIEKLSYRHFPESNSLHIILTAKEGKFSPQDVSFQGSSAFDLIFVLDTPDLERLGPIFQNWASLFYETPVINIDHHPGNDSFAKVNWVDLTATSTAEILLSFLEALSPNQPLLDADIATALLAGIITDTGSFQNANTTPKSLTVAAQLVAAGARQQEIIRSVYKTKPLSTLRLWGKILSQIHHEGQHRFVWAAAAASDFAEAGATETETSGLVDELLKAVPDIDFALLFSEHDGGLHGSLRATKAGISVADIARLFGGGGHEAAAAFDLPGKTLAEVPEAIEKIKSFRRPAADAPRLGG